MYSILYLCKRIFNLYIPEVSDEYLIVEYDGLCGCLYVSEGGHLKHHSAHVVGVAAHLQSPVLRIEK